MFYAECVYKRKCIQHIPSYGMDEIQFIMRTHMHTHTVCLETANISCYICWMPITINVFECVVFIVFSHFQFFFLSFDGHFCLRALTGHEMAHTHTLRKISVKMVYRILQRKELVVFWLRNVKGVLFYNIYVEAIHLCNIISGGKDFSVVSCIRFCGFCGYEGKNTRAEYI